MLRSFVEETVRLDRKIERIPVSGCWIMNEINYWHGVTMEQVDKFIESKRLEPENVQYLISRLERVVELLNAGESHMAIAKLLADIAALKALGEE